jgi:hypothetical protein
MYNELPDAVDPAMFTRPNAGDEQLFVTFYMGVLKNESKSLEQGRPIFDDVESVRILVPGDRNSVVDRPATPDDKRRFAKQYDGFKRGLKDEEQTSGVRLTDWPFLTKGQCEELRFLGLRTVEQLAECRDDVCARVPGLVTLKQNAGVWLGKTKGTAEAAKTAKLIADQAAQIATLQEAIRDQAARIEKMIERSERAAA